MTQLRKEWHGKNELWIYNQFGCLGKVINIWKVSLEEFLARQAPAFEDNLEELIEILKNFKKGYAYKITDDDSIEEWASSYSDARWVAQNQGC